LGKTTFNLIIQESRIKKLTADSNPPYATLIRNDPECATADEVKLMYQVSLDNAHSMHAKNHESPSLVTDLDMAPI
jgi:hypothetical protein